MWFCCYRSYHQRSLSWRDLSKSLTEIRQMDPFSVIGGAAGLLGVVSQCVKATSVFIKNASNSQDEAAVMMEALSMLESILRHVIERKDVSSCDTESPLWAKDGMLDTTLQSCERTVSRLSSKLSEASKAPRLLGSIRWPLKRQEYLDSMRDVRMYAQWIQICFSAKNDLQISFALGQLQKISQASVQSKELANKLHSKRCVSLRV